jgi:hypothetical protein
MKKNVTIVKIGGIILLLIVIGVYVLFMKNPLLCWHFWILILSIIGGTWITIEVIIAPETKEPPP